ncbi:hypothetical protein OG851_37990 [Streptomyces sp. NBC_00161]|uniref:hypothetical protein n=1 Tax=Streptomyces sp. NBC_00161 TaxID=2975671 RepID=UPI0032538821
MTLKEGQRVKLAADTRLTDWVAMTGEPATPPDAVAGSVYLAAGTEGTVERVVEHQHQSHEAREYERLKSLLDTFGREMPTESRRQLEEQVGSLEPAWIAYEEQRHRVTVRVRLDLGFILDDTREEVFTPA